jgi:hypothetical protein
MTARNIETPTARAWRIWHIYSLANLARMCRGEEPVAVDKPRRGKKAGKLERNRRRIS